MDPLPPAEEFASSIDARQDEALEQLELLNQRIEAVIKEFSPQLGGPQGLPQAESPSLGKAA